MPLFTSKIRLPFCAFWLSAGLCLSCAGDLRAATYYLAAAGDDTASGQSPETAWRTIGRANREHVQPGDSLLLEGGQSFQGSLALAAVSTSGSAGPILLGSFGQGRATVQAGTGTGVKVEGLGNLTIERLIVVGAGRTNNSGYGIQCENTLTNGQRLTNLCLRDVEARGFGIFGILISGTQAGYEHVQVTNCVLRDNLRGGMEIAGRLPWDASNYAHADVRVSACQAFDNTGDPSYLKNHSGSGIVLYQVDGGTIENCRAWNNGALCRSQGGGVGLWTCASRRIVIQHCESFANRTSGADGGGFDIDGGSEDCLLQYNYSHDNDGPGLMVYTYPYASYRDRGSVVRFNISENDSRRSRRYAGLWVQSDGPEMTGVEIYNNTILIGPWTDQAAFVSGHRVSARLRNNIFISEGAAVPLRVAKPTGALRMENNLYWRIGGPPGVAWGDRLFTSLPDWREATGQESVDGQATGLFADPGLRQIQERTPYLPSNAFQPAPNSPASEGGLNLRPFLGAAAPERDFARRPLPVDAKWPLGAVSGP